jgi:hypothetical protein
MWFRKTFLNRPFAPAQKKCCWFELNCATTSMISLVTVIFTFLSSITHYLHELNNIVMDWSNWYDFFLVCTCLLTLDAYARIMKQPQFLLRMAVSTLYQSDKSPVMELCVSALIFADNKSRISPIYYVLNGQKQNLCLFEYIICRVFQQCARNWIYTRKGDCILVILDTFMTKADFLL